MIRASERLTDGSKVTLLLFVTVGLGPKWPALPAMFSAPREPLPASLQ